MRFLGISIVLVAITSVAGCVGEEPDTGTTAQAATAPKVAICHIPPGENAGARTITVPQSAVASHLAHGDSAGPCVCPPGEQWTCYSGPAATEGVGACRGGVRTCDADAQGYSSCVGEVVPVTEVCQDGVDNDCDHAVDEDCRNATPIEEACVPNSDYELCGDGIDNDCNDAVDEDCVCIPNSSSACYDGPPEAAGVGACVIGTRYCDSDGTGYGGCIGEVWPVAEVCGDDIDDDCDGVADNGCVCAPDSTLACYAGPPGTSGVGVCRTGVETCNATGTAYGECVGAITPVDEVCGDGLDNDCDGELDETCFCVPRSTLACYTGPAGTEGVGACTAGAQFCSDDGSAYGACVGAITPVAEVCGDNVDNDCDGQIDDGCVCAPGTSSPCYSGPAGTDGVGICRAGVELCDASGTGYGACVGEITPLDEVCGDGADNDCDGFVDDGCVCAPDSTITCYAGPAGTEGIGACRAGTQTCNAIGTGYGACVGAVEPVADECGDGIDNDCDGQTDETCVCQPNSTQSCYPGAPGTEGVGACRAGTRTCNAAGSGYDACTGAVTPVVDVCGDGIDNDCDGRADEFCLGDRVWSDTDADGLQGASEPGLAGATLLLRSYLGGLVQVTTTNASGQYYFSNVVAGSYYIEVVPPTGEHLTVSDAGDDTLDSDFDPGALRTVTFSYTGDPTYTFDAGFVSSASR